MIGPYTLSEVAVLVSAFVALAAALYPNEVSPCA